MIESLLYTFSTQTVEPPTGTQIRMNAATPAAVTKLWLRYTTDDGIDAFYALERLASGATLIVQDKNDHLQAVKFQTAGAAVDKAGYFEVPVTYVSDCGAALGNNQTVLVALPSGVAEVPIPGPPGPLVTVAEAIAHLRLLPTDVDDADLQQKLTAAEAIILDYLNITAGMAVVIAGWTPETLPGQVRSAILLELGELYRFRGDDVSDENAPRDPNFDLSPVIVGLLRRVVAPVIA